MHAIAAAMLVLSVTAAEHADPLASLRWYNRVLLVLAPSGDDPRVTATRQRLAEAHCEVVEREIVVGFVYPEGVEGLGEGMVSPETAANLRRRFDAQANEFLVVLVGKDGGEKYRSPQVPDLARVFALIDTMPMRREEMRSGTHDCAAASGHTLDSDSN